MKTDIDILTDVLDLMSIHTFTKQFHTITNTLYNTYKDIINSNKNSDIYYRICHCVNISAYYGNEVQNGYECVKALIMNDTYEGIRHDLNNIYSNAAFYITEIENDTEKERSDFLEKLFTIAYNNKNANKPLSDTIFKYINIYLEKYRPDLYNK